mmetsp:Transcript_9062/g.26057  ORF Transcript_9062/g.26057 Transcript_9062/m.26057 type:complete len:391 (+) Transcript_9062:641-1813(+)
MGEIDTRGRTQAAAPASCSIGIQKQAGAMPPDQRLDQVVKASSKVVAVGRHEETKPDLRSEQDVRDPQPVGSVMLEHPTFGPCARAHTPAHRVVGRPRWRRVQLVKAVGAHDTVLCTGGICEVFDHKLCVVGHGAVHRPRWPDSWRDITNHVSERRRNGRPVTRDSPVTPRLVSTRAVRRSEATRGHPQRLKNLHSNELFPRHSRHFLHHHSRNHVAGIAVIMLSPWTHRRLGEQLGRVVPSLLDDRSRISEEGRPGEMLSEEFCWESAGVVEQLSQRDVDVLVAHRGHQVGKDLTDGRLPRQQSSVDQHSGKGRCDSLADGVEEPQIVGLHLLLIPNRTHASCRHLHHLSIVHRDCGQCGELPAGANRLQDRLQTSVPRHADIDILRQS